jgi:hypothetical protein
VRTRRWLRDGHVALPSRRGGLGHGAGAPLNLWRGLALQSPTVVVCRHRRGDRLSEAQVASSSGEGN